MGTHVGWRRVGWRKSRAAHVVFRALFTFVVTTRCAAHRSGLAPLPTEEPCLCGKFDDPRLRVASPQCCCNLENGHDTSRTNQVSPVQRWTASRAARVCWPPRSGWAQSPWP